MINLDDKKIIILKNQIEKHLKFLKNQLDINEALLKKIDLDISQRNQKSENLEPQQNQKLENIEPQQNQKSENLEPQEKQKAENLESQQSQETENSKPKNLEPQQNQEAEKDEQAIRLEKLARNFYDGMSQLSVNSLDYKKNLAPLEFLQEIKWSHKNIEFLQDIQSSYEKFKFLEDLKIAQLNSRLGKHADPEQNLCSNLQICQGCGKVNYNKLCNSCRIDIDKLIFELITKKIDLSSLTKNQLSSTLLLNKENIEIIEKILDRQISLDLDIRDEILQRIRNEEKSKNKN